MEECVFCKIINGEMDTELVYEDEKVVAFEDINPQAPVHLLIVPKEHTPTLLDLDNYDIIGHIFKIANKLSAENNIDEEGFRIIANCKEGGGQIVFHIHFHLLGGKDFS